MARKKCNENPFLLRRWEDQWRFRMKWRLREEDLLPILKRYVPALEERRRWGGPTQ